MKKREKCKKVDRLELDLAKEKCEKRKKCRKVDRVELNLARFCIFLPLPLPPPLPRIAPNRSQNGSDSIDLRRTIIFFSDMCPGKNVKKNVKNVKQWTIWSSIWLDSAYFLIPPPPPG